MASIDQMISDYVANRLDRSAACAVEAAARRDERIARAIHAAEVVHRRVAGRLSSRH